jgi:hypothetical protein
MAIFPSVRYMIPCENCRVDSEQGKRIDIFGLLTNINSQEEPPYPLVYRELCVFLALTETRGRGKIQIVCVHEETGEVAFATPG